MLSRVSSFARLLLVHARRHWLTYALIAAAAHMFSANYRIGVNETPSLPQTIFLIHKRAPVAKGDYVSFTVRPSQAEVKVNPNMIITKIIVGAPGDRVTVDDRVVKVNGVPVGVAKPFSLKQEPLDPLRPVVVPPGYWYVMGLHRDSLDSRYSIVGLVSNDQILGRAHPII